MSKVDWVSQPIRSLALFSFYELPLDIFLLLLSAIFRKTQGLDRGYSVSSYWDDRISSFCILVSEGALVSDITPPGSLPTGCRTSAREGGWMKLSIWSLTVSLLDSVIEKYPEMPKISLTWGVRSPSTSQVKPGYSAVCLLPSHSLFLQIGPHIPNKTS